MKYIHENPLKAGIVDRIGQYKWRELVKEISCAECLDIQSLKS